MLFNTLNLNLNWILLFAAFFTMHSSLNAQESNKQDAVLGTYWTPNKEGKIEIYKAQGKYYGKTIWTHKTGVDTLNPDPKKRSQPLLGLVFLYDFVYDSEQYVDGTIYDPRNGKEYSCKMWLENGDLKARGYIGFSLLGRTELFERIR